MNVQIEKKPQRFIQRSSPLPVYRQVADRLEEELLQQSLTGEKVALPSENELAATFNVSRVTVRQALDRLHFKGLIYREKGKGSYPRALHLNGVTGLGSFTAEVQRSGVKPSSKLISLSPVSSLPDGMLRHVVRPPEPDTTFFRLSRIRLADDTPIAREDAYLPSEMFPGLTKEDVADGSLYAAMYENWGYEPAWADAAIEPLVADEELADQLETEIGAPLVVAWRVTSTEQDEVLEYVRSIYRGNGFALTVHRHKLG